ncbi:hypothetical protein SO802_018407 [Lithocarpus litseifolius]|uniref:Aminotransferase-like plant mobile domain-containing protein n=1 Tax=Lithocarpus litseifolius TaxID=425828 RepID=A0AAW2CNL7_9ROSI
MSITLQDITILTGLPIDGTTVCGPINLDWGIDCQNLLGVTPPANALEYGGLKITWVRNTFSNLPEDANAITTQLYAKAYMFQVLALLFGNKSQSSLHCCFLHLLANFGIAGKYSWGSATLAFLYKELCTAAIKKKHGGCRWDTRRTFTHTPTHVLCAYCSNHDTHNNEQVVWTLYEDYLLDWCLAKKHIWMTTAPLLCFQIVEYYHLERVVQQFGLLQRCPKCPTDNFDKSVHCVKMTGKSGVNWSRKHAHYYRLWNERAQKQVGDDNFHETEINNMLSLAVANQQRTHLTAQQVLPAIVEGLNRVKLSMEAHISSIPTERVTHFGRRQRHQGRQHLQTSTETRSSTPTQCRQFRNDEAGPSTFTQHNTTQAEPSTSAPNEPPSMSIIQLMSTSTACLYMNRLDYPLL